MINLNIFDTATIIPTPIDFGDFRCLFKRSFNELTFHNRVPPLIMRGISNLIYNIDPHRWIHKCINIKQFINTTYRELLMLRYDCPPNNEETTERILEATVVETAQYVLVDVWNGMHFYFDIDHITPVHGAFSLKKSTDFWDVMTIHHHSNLQILPSIIN